MPERELLAALVRLTAVLAVVAAAVGWVLVGPEGAASAVAGVALVAPSSVGAAAALAWAAPRGPRAALVALGGGVVGRLVVYALALSGLARVPWIAWSSLAGAVAASLAVTLGFELRELARRPRLLWVDPDAGHGAGPTVRRDADVTRSER